MSFFNILFGKFTCCYPSYINDNSEDNDNNSDYIMVMIMIMTTVLITDAIITLTKIIITIISSEYGCS